MGTQDGAPGDNFAPLLADDVIGNDIFIGGGGFDEMIGEGGDDIFVGSDAQDKMDGMSGFDWITYKNDRFGVTADLTSPSSAASARSVTTCAAVRGLTALDSRSFRRSRGAVRLDIRGYSARQTNVDAVNDCHVQAKAARSTLRILR